MAFLPRVFGMREGVGVLGATDLTGSLPTTFPTTRPPTLRSAPSSLTLAVVLGEPPIVEPLTHVMSWCPCEAAAF